MQTFVEIGGQTLEARVVARSEDHDWDGRESRAVTCVADYATAAALFRDNAPWTLVRQDDPYDNGQEIITPEPIRTDLSDYSVAGDITVHRDGRVTVKMGKLTDGEMLQALREELAR